MLASHSLRNSYMDGVFSLCVILEVVKGQKSINIVNIILFPIRLFKLSLLLDFYSLPYLRIHLILSVKNLTALFQMYTQCLSFYTRTSRLRKGGGGGSIVTKMILTKDEIKLLDLMFIISIAVRYVFCAWAMFKLLFDHFLIFC